MNISLAVVYSPVSHEHELTVEQGDRKLDGLPAIGMFGDARHRSAEKRLAPHYNPGIEICLCRSGVYRWVVEGRVVEIKPGELSITRPWERHSGQNNVLGPGRLTWIVLAAAGIAADGSTAADRSASGAPAPGAPALAAPVLAGELGADSPWVLSTIAAATTAYLGAIQEAIPLFDRIAGEFRFTRPARDAVVRSAYLTLLALVARRLAEREDEGEVQESDQVPAQVLAVLNDVAQLPQREWTSTSMAERAGLGLTAFTDWCRRATGRSPRWYLLEQRLARARERLAEQASVTEAALDAGFSSSQHFSATFRKLYGETPTAYLRRINSPDDRRPDWALPG